MSTMSVTIMGIERYLLGRGEKSLFEYITIPSGIDKDILINTIMNDSANFELLYSNPNYLRFMITNWFKTHYYTFNKWYEALNLEYNPLDNYDRYEEYQDSEHSNSLGKSLKSSTTTDINTGTDTMNSTSTSSDIVAGDTTEQVVPYEDSTLTDRSKTLTNNQDNATTTGSTTSTSSANHNGTERYEDNTTSNGNRTLTHTAHLHGNIGVTTSMELIKSQLDLVTFNIIQQISDLFCTDFCVMIY